MKTFIFRIKHFYYEKRDTGATPIPANLQDYPRYGIEAPGENVAWATHSARKHMLGEGYSGEDVDHMLKVAQVEEKDFTYR